MKGRTRPRDYANRVFINCPFDTQYEAIFDALIFAIFDCGFIARCALEVDDSSQNRLERIFLIIDRCKFAIHDLSRTEPDPVSHLPRFNMYGRTYNAEKNCSILDTERFRYQRFISDISGQDIKAHASSAPKAAAACAIGSITRRAARPFLGPKPYSNDTRAIDNSSPRSAGVCSFSRAR